jgi:D-beta-D-heptose 7-phosphate kinase/D-beta-D-heptose 1-phosphate adenosyltransferase
MMRIDDEEEMPPIDGADVERHLDDVALLIISDYGKGSVGSLAILIERCGRLDIPVFVDPKRASWHRYQGASVITPNEQEASDVIGPWLTDGDLTEGICDALGAIRCSNALVTRGARGVSLIAHHGDRLDIPSTAREVFDVTGAGDTVIAMLAAAYVRGYSLADAARIANAAAGIVVGRLGASQISADEFASICRGI